MAHFFHASTITVHSGIYLTTFLNQPFATFKSLISGLGGLSQNLPILERDAVFTRPQGLIFDLSKPSNSQTLPTWSGVPA